LLTDIAQANGVSKKQIEKQLAPNKAKVRHLTQKDFLDYRCQYRLLENENKCFFED